MRDVINIIKEWTPCVVYTSMLPEMRQCAARHGYALAIHGSMQRDCDIVLVPWIEKVSTVEELIDALKEVVGGYFASPEWDHCAGKDQRNEAKKPHGQRSFVLHLSDKGGSGPYFDIRVMPVIPTKEQP